MEVKERDSEERIRIIEQQNAIEPQFFNPEGTSYHQFLGLDRTIGDAALKNLQNTLFLPVKQKMEAIDKVMALLSKRETTTILEMFYGEYKQLQVKTNLIRDGFATTEILDPDIDVIKEGNMIVLRSSIKIVDPTKYLISSVIQQHINVDLDKEKDMPN